MFLKSNNTKVHTMIVEQIKDVEGCLIAFEKFLKAAVNKDTVPETIEALSDGVHQMENAADRSLRMMIDSLSDGAFLPATREELISIATNCDKVANKCEEVALQVTFQGFRFPEFCADALVEMMKDTTEQFKLLETAISQLFGDFGALLKDHSILDQIRACESKVDTNEVKLFKLIYKMDAGLAERQQAAHFVERVADVSDIIENIADKIQIMLITRKA